MTPVDRFPQAVCFFTLGWLATTLSASAQITPDGTLPNNTVVEINGNSFDITGGSTEGGNLFHSFEDFSVPTNGGAFFNNAVDIDNIISRVTGGRISDIDGLIQANGTANLFLINPNGIVFGPNAQLQIGGSFFGSTASGINFADGSEFSATNPQNPLLTVNVPIGLQYGTNAADVQVQGAQLAVSMGGTLALLGGNVRLAGNVTEEFDRTLSAPGGRVELGGLLGVGEIALNEDGGFSFPDGVVRGHVSLTDGSLVNVGSSGVEDAGDINITANFLSLTDGSSLDAGSFGVGDSGEISISVNENVTVQNSKIVSDTLVNPDIPSSGMGDAGNISITANGFVTITGTSEISSNAFNIDAPTEGAAGSIDISGNDGVRITNSRISSISNNNNFIPDAGTIRLMASAGSIDLESSELSTTNFGSNTAGSIQLDASDRITISNGSKLFSDAFNEERPNESGVAGNISISAPNGIEFLNSTITSSSFTDLESEDSGNIHLTASAGSIDLANSEFTTRNFGSGTAGSIFLDAGDRITIFDGSNLLSDAFISEESGEGGMAGTINLVAPNGIEIFHSTITSQSQSSNRNDRFGNISITATDGSVQIDLDSDDTIESPKISTTNLGSGFAGNIFINARDEVTVSNSTLSSDGNFGTISIGNLLIPDRIDIQNSTISTTSNGAEFAGRIEIDARDEVAISDRSRVASEGNLGTISIGRDLFFVPNVVNIQGSELSTTNFGSGVAGNVEIDARDEVAISDGSKLDSNGNLGTISIGSFFSVPNVISIQNSTLSTTSNGAEFAGNIELNTRNNIEITNSKITSNGNQGNISIGNLLFSVPLTVNIQNSELSTTSRGEESAGRIEINSRDEVAISDGSKLDSNGNLGTISIGRYLFSTPNVINIQGSELTTQADSDIAGFLSLSANRIAIVNDSQLSSSATNDASAGSIALDAPNGVDIFNSRITSESQSNDLGNDGGSIGFGTISITAANGSVNLNLNSDFNNPQNSPRISTTNSGTGFAGDIFIDARDEVTISNSLLSSDGNFGIISIGNSSTLTPNTIAIQNSRLTTQADSDIAGFLSLSANRIAIVNDSQLSSSATNDASAGSIALDAPNGVDIFNSTITSESASNNLDNNRSDSDPLSAGTIRITAMEGSVNLNLNSDGNNPENSISTTNRGGGTAGDIEIDARDEVTVSNSRLSSNGELGIISIGDSSASTLNTIRIQDSTISTIDRGGGTAGNINLNAREDVTFGTSTLSSDATNDGEAGGTAGSITVNARNLDLDRTELRANSTGGNGGNISVTARELVELRNRSRLSTNAGTENAPGNGGQITVTSQFLIGSGNSDITANAFEGAGGAIRINGDGIFGLAVRNRQTSRNDITAISQTNPSLGGTIAINSPEVDASGLVALSESPVDVTALVGEDLCSQGEGSEFVVTGRGGLPPNPGDVLNHEPNLLEWTTRDGEESDTATETHSPSQYSPSQYSPSQYSPSQLIEATGWVLNEDGHVVLVAQAPGVTLSNPAFVQPGCEMRERTHRRTDAEIRELGGGSIFLRQDLGKATKFSLSA